MMQRNQSGRGRGAGRQQQHQQIDLQAAPARRSRGNKYTAAEIDQLLDLVEAILPTVDW